MEITQTLEQDGAAVGDIRDKKTGKLLVNNRTPRNKYYTPDGREQWKIPQHRERQDGVIYDVFIAQGYTLTPPENPKLYCKGCDKWHDTQEGVDECVGNKNQFPEAMQKSAERELGKEHIETLSEKDKTIANLEASVDKLTKLMEAQLGEKV